MIYVYDYDPLCDYWIWTEAGDDVISQLLWEKIKTGGASISQDRHHITLIVQWPYKLKI